MGLRRLLVRHGEELRLHRRLKQRFSFGTGALLLFGALTFIACEIYFFSPDVLTGDFEFEGHDLSGYRQLATSGSCDKEEESASAYPPDPIISRTGTPKSYKNAPAAEKCGIIVHVIVVAYCLLGLNTVCDVYFCGALDMMVDKWKVKPDVAGATFMAAGGSAPELFTSLIGAVVTVNDVGFGTIVGSAVFNVLAVIGACGVCAKEPIQLTWWPLFRDCTCYIIGLSLLAICAYGKTITNACGKKEGGGGISLWEAIILFLAYVCYCTLMYFNEKLEQRIKSLLGTATGSKPDEAPASCSVIKVAPLPDVEANPIKDLRAGTVGDNAPPSQPENEAPGRPGHHVGCDQLPAGEKPQSRESVAESKLLAPPAASAARGPQLLDDGSNHHIENHIRVVHHKVRRPSKRGNVSPRDCEKRRPSNRSEGSTQPPPEQSQADTQTAIQPFQESLPGDEDVAEEGVAKTAGEEEPQDEEAMSDVSDDVEGLMTRPEDRKERIMWYFSLPIYGSLYYLIPKPTERCFLATFVISLCWIAGFSFFLVYCVELFSEAILGGGNNVTVVMGFTVLAAGTSIPDLVSSMAVARAGEGDMAVSSSIGSNIFDILVGLPVPWIIKIAIVERSADYEIHIKSPYIVLYVCLLLFMVLCVIVSIHFLSWKLNKTLGVCMAALYCIFLCVVLPVELIDKGPYV